MYLKDLKLTLNCFTFLENTLLPCEPARQRLPLSPERKKQDKDEKNIFTPGFLWITNISFSSVLCLFQQV